MTNENANQHEPTPNEEGGSRSGSPSCSASCYDERGYKRIFVELHVGDEVDYKADGIPGSYRGVVVAIRKRVKIELRKKDGVPLSTPRTSWVKPRFLAVFRDGRRVTTAVEPPKADPPR